MFISEIDGENSVTIDVMKGTNKITFESKSVSVLDDSLLIDCVRYNNQIINMNGENLYITITINTEPLPIKFSNVKIDTVKHDNKVYHLIKTDKQGLEVNRRENFRVYVGENGLAQISQHHKGRNVIVKDVSLTGFAIVSSEDLDAENSIVRLTYKDRGTTIILVGKVVRKEIVEENKIVYGCELIHKPKGLEKYLSNKQVEKKRNY